MAKGLDCDFELNKFEFLSSHFVYFWTFGKCVDCLTPLPMCYIILPVFFF